MVIFHSYVKLPECITYMDYIDKMDDIETFIMNMYYWLFRKYIYISCISYSLDIVYQ